MTQVSFPIHYSAVLDRVSKIRPIRYGKTRNFIDGDVSYLSPYISRGVISTKQVMESVLSHGYAFSSVEKFIQELAWRDYWQQIWKSLGNEIDQDVKRAQPKVKNHQMPAAIQNANTGIEAIDGSINRLYSHGYMHNHVRMYVASIACNIGGSHWYIPAKWMYYHLLDGDWASNALSWQWVAGANSHKKYFANQANVNKYCHTRQRGTFLDVSYVDFENMDMPGKLMELIVPALKCDLPGTPFPDLDGSKPTLIYNSYNLDPGWHQDMDANRVLLMEPSHFKKYPVSKHVLNFILGLRENIPGVQVAVMEFDQLVNQFQLSEVLFKEHPTCTHYRGTEEPRDWMFSVTGYYPSFFSFWKKCLREWRR